jgi:hypothetical protein
MYSTYFITNNENVAHVVNRVKRLTRSDAESFYA